MKFLLVKLQVVCIAFLLVFSGCHKSAGLKDSNGRLSSQDRDLHTKLLIPDGLRKMAAIDVVPIAVNQKSTNCVVPEEQYSQLVSSLQKSVDMQIIERMNADNKPAVRKDARVGILKVNVLSCKRRIGSGVGVTEPASISFEWDLIDRDSGQKIWSASYYQQDKSISENLLEIKNRLAGGVGWKSTSELFNLGFGKASKALSSARNSQFRTKSS